MSLLPLFPDLIEQHNPINHFADHLRSGHGVWSIGGMFYRRRGALMSEGRCIVIIHDNEKYSFAKDRIGKHWRVEIRHYRDHEEIVTSGWGSSRTTKATSKRTNKFTERTFFTRDEACDFAERILEVLERMQARKEREQ